MKVNVIKERVFHSRTTELVLYCVATLFSACLILAHSRSSRQSPLAPFIWFSLRLSVRLILEQMSFSSLPLVRFYLR